MLTLQAEATQSRAYFLGGWRSEIHFELLARDAVIPVAHLFDALLKASPDAQLVLQHAEVRNEQGTPIHIIKNMRGCPNELLASRYNTQTRKGEEVFFSSGVLHQADQEDEIEEIPFEYQVRTEFERFEGRVIEHRLVANSTPIVAPALGNFDLKILPRLIPAEVQHIRFGIEHFKPTLFGGLASFSGPSVVQRFLLSIERGSIRGEIWEDCKGSSGVVPQFEGNLLLPLDVALDRLDLYVGLVDDLTRQLQR